MEIIDIIKDNYPKARMVIIEDYASFKSEVTATKNRDADPLLKPFTPEEFTRITKNVIE